MPPHTPKSEKFLSEISAEPKYEMNPEYVDQIKADVENEHLPDDDRDDHFERGLGEWVDSNDRMESYRSLK